MASELASSDRAAIVVPLIGQLTSTGSRFERVRTGSGLDWSRGAGRVGLVRRPASSRHQAATLRSYGLDLLRWFRFLWAVEVPWPGDGEQGTRDFARWMQVTGMPPRPHWRHPHERATTSSKKEYTPSVRKPASETVLRGFYDFHRDAGSGPVLKPSTSHSPP